jgi:hypothetical protein
MHCSALRFKTSASLCVDLPQVTQIKALICREQAESVIERREEDFGVHGNPTPFGPRRNNENITLVTVTDEKRVSLY